MLYCIYSAATGSQGELKIVIPFESINCITDTGDTPKLGILHNSILLPNSIRIDSIDKEV